MAATLALVIAIAVVVAIILGTKSPSSLKAASEGHNQSSGAATVQRRDLVQTDTESGTLSYANSQTVYNRMTGTITWLPAVGQVIRPGQALYRVNGAPVILMDGSTPAYRDLNSSDSDGQDILQLNRNLVALGFNPDGIVVDDVWQAATTAGVDLLQESLGETQTGSLPLGKIVFLPGAQLISTVDATIGSDGSGSGSNPNGSNASYTPSGNPSPEFASLTTTTPATTTPSTTTPTTPTPTTPKRHHKHHQNPSNAQTIATLRALLRAATAQLQAERAEQGSAGGNGNNGHSPSGGSGHSPSGGSGHSPHSGNSNNNSGNGGNSNNNSGNGGNNGNNGNSGGGGSATAILGTTSTRLVVTVDLDATKQSEARVGEPVTVEMPGGNTVNGRVSAVSPVAQSSSNNGNGNNGNGNNGNGNNGNNGNGSSGATIPVTITLSGRQTGAGLDQASVSVNFAEAKANNVLSVPVTALLAQAGGGYAVQEAAAPHTLIPVNTGLFAAGYVEISGRGIYRGLAVTDSQG